MFVDIQKKKKARTTGVVAGSEVLTAAESLHSADHLGMMQLCDPADLWSQLCCVPLPKGAAGLCSLSLDPRAAKACAFALTLARAACCRGCTGH